MTKDCTDYHGAAGEVCTILSSNLTQIEAGSKIVYRQAAGATSLGSDVVLDLPGPGNNAALGHCAVDFLTRTGRCTFSGGTGKFEHFQASVNVSHVAGFIWDWNGSYSFNPHD